MTDEFRDDFGRTYLFYAASNGNLSICKSLIEKDADLNIQDNFGNTPIFAAIENAHFEICKLIIQDFSENKKCKLDMKNRYLKTPLHLASRLGLLEFCKLLVENTNISLNETDVFGFTPLHDAVHNGRINVAKYLIQKGSDVNFQTHLGNTPMHLAVQKNNLEMCNFLSNNETINLDIKNLLGHTSLDIARKSNFLDIYSLLLTKKNNGIGNEKTSNSMLNRFFLYFF